jgi:hypothetical protein
MKTLTQKIQENAQQTNEGLFDVFKVRKQFTELQGVLQDVIDQELETNPKKYRSGKQLMDSMHSEAKSLYNRIITMKDEAMSFNDWWKNYSNANANFYDATIFAV